MPVNGVSKILVCLFSCLCLMPLGSKLCAYTKPAYGPGQVRLDLRENEDDFLDISIQDRSGERVDVEALLFNDEQGVERSLSSFMRPGRPAVLAMVYYDCPSLCGLLLNGIVSSLRRLDWVIGREYDVIFVSMDHREDHELAAWKKRNYVADYGKPESAENWHFLTGKQEHIEALASQIGFGFKWVPEINEYAHSAGFFVLSPEGQISRTLYGVEFDPLDVRLSLLEASQGRIGSMMDRVLLFCYRFDPNTQGYALHALNIVRAGGAVTLFVLALYLFIFWRRQLKTDEGKAS